MHDLTLLIIIYGFQFAVLLSHALIKAREYGKLKYITLVRFMYAVIYGLVPFLVHLYVQINGVNTRELLAFDYSASGIFLFYLMSVFSIWGYIGLNFGYRAKFVLRHKSRRNLSGAEEYGAVDYQYSDMTLFISAMIMFAVGLLSFMIWSRAFGGITAILEYASRLRSGVDVGITNRYTVFKRFAPLLQFSNILFLSLWLKNKKIISFAMVIFSTIFSTYYLIANDGRAPLVMHFVALIYLLATNKRNRREKISYFWISIFACVALFLMRNYSEIYSAIATGERQELSFDIFASIRKEFSWTVHNIQAVHLALEDNPFMFRLPLEIISGICGILPSGFRPEGLAKLEQLNTGYWIIGATVTYYGGKPPDIITTGIYTMNYVGIFLLPMFYGMILRKLDGYFNNKDADIFSKSLFAVLLYPVVRTIAYTNFDGLLLNVFYIFGGCLIIWVISKFSPKSTVMEVDCSE